MLRIKEICKEKRMTLAELAKKLGINYQSLHNVMTGNPTLSTLNKIADILGVSTSELLDRQNTIVCPKCGSKFEMEE